jgi:dihydropteroate synthase
VSVDTYKAKVAQAAVEAGADIINDVSGLQWDPKMGKTLAGLDCGVVVMHARGKPDEWASLSKVPDMVMLVKRELRERAEAAVTSKVRRDRIVLDPGFGFGKRFEENYPLLRRFHEFHELYFPLMAGVSRKSWIGRALSSDGKDAAIPGRLFGTLGAEVALALKGAHIIRTHDVKSSVEALRLADVVAG